MKVYLFLIAIATIFVSSGCRGPVCDQPDFITSGIGFCSEGAVSPDELDMLVQVTEQKVQEVYPQVTDTVETYKREKVNVFFVDDDLSLGCEEIKHDIFRCKQNIGGATIDGWNIYVRYRPCLANTSLAHELLHVIEHHYLGGPQGEDQHSTPCFFMQDATEQGKKYTDMIESKIRTELYPILPSCQP